MKGVRDEEKNKIKAKTRGVALMEISSLLNMSNLLM